MFLDEMRHFLACVNGSEQPRCSLRDGEAALRIALAAKLAMAAAKDPSQAAGTTFSPQAIWTQALPQAT
jgi:hypothetical protein